MTDSNDPLRVIPTDAPPIGACRKTGDFVPPLTLMGEPVSYTHLTLPTICSV